MRKKMRRQVRKDVRAAYAPVLDALRNEKAGLRDERKAELGRVGNIYEDLAKSLGGMLPQNVRANQGIMQGVQGALGSLTGAVMDPAMAKALSTMGAGFATNLGSQALASQSGIASGIAAGGMQGADAEARIIERYKQNLNDITSQMHGVRGDRAQTFLQQLQAAKEFQLARKEQKLRAEQFEKEFGFRKNQTSKANKADRREERQAEKAQNWVISQAEQEALNKRQGRWRKQLGIPELKATLNPLKTEVKRLEEAMAQPGLDPLQVNAIGTQLATARQTLKEVQAQLGRKRKKVQKKTTRYKKKVRA